MFVVNEIVVFKLFGILLLVVVWFMLILGFILSLVMVWLNDVLVFWGCEGVYWVVL